MTFIAEKSLLQKKSSTHFYMDDGSELAGKKKSKIKQFS